MGAAVLSAAMLAAIALFMGLGSMATGLEADSEGLELSAFDATAGPAATLPLVFQIAATGGPAAFVPWVFVIAFAALSVVHAFKVFVRFAGRPGFTPFKDETHETTRVDMLQVTLSLRSFCGVLCW